MSETYLQSGAVAKLTDLSTNTLRHYERLGLIGKPLCMAAGYRQYPGSVVERAPAETIADMQILRDQMRSILQDWDTRLSRTPDGHKAMLLESRLEERTK